MKQWVIVVDVTVEADTAEQAEEIVNDALWDTFGDLATMGTAHER